MLVRYSVSLRPAVWVRAARERQRSLTTKKMQEETLMLALMMRRVSEMIQVTLGVVVRQDGA